MPLLPPIDSQNQGLPFLKMHGLGNDFIILDCRERPLLSPEQIRLVADRRRSIGCDQFIQLTAAKDPRADIFMHINNPDGSVAGACGNATRCVADLIMHELRRDQIIIETISGLLPSHRLENGLITVDMGPPRLDWQQIPLSQDLSPALLDEQALSDCPDILPFLPGTAVSMGNPHCIFFVADADAIDLSALGPQIENHPLFPERTNVEFVSVIAPAHSDKPTQLRCRVWERGAGITQACGSGACAVTVAAHQRRLLTDRADIQLDGGILSIEWRQSDQHVLMSGPVSYICHGQFTPQLLNSSPHCQ